MAKKVTVEVEVNSSQIDQTAQKLGELKDFGKGLKIQYDIDGKPLDIVIDKSLNLQKQARILTAELRRTKEGTAEFQLLSAKLGDVQDGLDRTKVKSGDLFTSLQLLPGPVGQFASQINGAIATLKVFSGFSLKDLKFQLKETLDDFKNIALSIGKATGITKIYTTINDFLAASFIKVGVAEGVAATGARAFAAALTATGVGAIVVALGFLVSKLMEVGDEADLTAGKVARLNTEFSKLDKDAKLLGEQRIAQMKAEGATEAQLYAERKKLKEQEVEQSRNAFKQFQTQMNAAEVMQGKDTEGYRNALKSRQAAEERLKQAKSDLIVMGYNEEERLRKENEAKDKEAKNRAIANSKATQDKIVQDTKTYYDKLLSEQNKYELLKATSEEEAAVIKLDQDAKQQIKEINQLKISEQKKAELIKQINTNLELEVGKVVFDLRKKIQKKQQEDIIKTQDAEIELYKKMRDIKTQLIKDEYEKGKLVLEEKADDDIEAVNKSIASAELKAKVINAIERKLALDIDKLKEDTKKKEADDRIKKLDEDIRFLEITNEANKNSFVAYWKGRQEILDTAQQRELSALNLTEAQKLAIEQKYVQLSKDLQREKFQAYLGYVSAGLTAVAGFYSQQQTINGLAMDNELAKVKDNAVEQDKIKEKYFYKNQKAQKGQAIIATLQSAIQAFSALAGIPVVGPALGAAAAAAALVFGYKQVDLIAGQTYQSSITNASSAETPNPAMANFGRNYEQGGLIGGKRHAEGGTLIEAEKGEAIMTRGAVTMFAPLLSTLNQMGGGTSFAPSLMTTSFDAPVRTQPSQQQAPLIVKSYVVSSELTSEQNKQARLKDLSTL